MTQASICVGSIWYFQLLENYEKNSVKKLCLTTINHYGEIKTQFNAEIFHEISIEVTSSSIEVRFQFTAFEDFLRIVVSIESSRYLFFGWNDAEYILWQIVRTYREFRDRILSRRYRQSPIEHLTCIPHATYVIRPGTYHLQIPHTFIKTACKQTKMNSIDHWESPFIPKGWAERHMRASFFVLPHPYAPLSIGFYVMDTHATHDWSKCTHIFRVWVHIHICMCVHVFV